MFWWTDRYRQVASIPNYDQLGSFSYYVIRVVGQLTLFSVPSFLFISGFFAAYAARGSSSRLGWRTVKARIAGLLWPYLVWSSIVYVSELAEGMLLGNGRGYSLGEFLKRLVVGNVDSAYFFVPLLCQLYLLAPLMVPLGTRRPRLLLILTAFIQLSMIGLLYLLPDRYRTISDVGGGAGLFVWGVFYFAFGLVCGFHYKPITSWLARVKWVLVGVVILVGILTITESEVLFSRLTRMANWAYGPHRFSAFLYAGAFILCFLAFDRVRLPFSAVIDWIGTRSYGIYLVSGISMATVARVVYIAAPWMLAYQGLFGLLLVVSAGGIPVLLMTLVRKSRARRLYPTLFG
jgi:surface polysaccharide O-acyltransferase-like enzyme